MKLPTERRTIINVFPQLTFVVTKLFIMSYEKYQSCIDACYNCATECRHCTNACLEEKDVKDLTHCIKLNNDCAAMCVLSAKLTAGGSEFAIQLGELCAAMCNTCAKECEKHAHMEHCRKCAEVCRACAKECRLMSRETLML